MNQKLYKKYFIILFIASLFVRVLIAFTTELGNDEVYYRLYAQPLQWNYFDHPLAVGWLIRFSTFNLMFDNDFFIRFGSILCGSITLIIIYNCGKLLQNEKSGFLSAAVYSASIYGTVISGTFILPDSPQMLFWSLSLICIIIISKKSISNSKQNYYLILFGLCVGFAMLCKVHSVFLWIGFGLYVLLRRRDILSQYGFYLSILLTMLFIIPMIKWNIDNNFITYNYHSNRVNHFDGGINTTSFFTFNFGQIFYTSIILFPVFIKAVISFLKNPKQQNQEPLLILLFVSLPLILVAIILSLFNTVLPHWTGPSFAGISIFTGIYFSNKTDYTKIPKILSFALVFLVFICVSGLFVINYYPGTLGSKVEKKLGFGDFTLDMNGWKEVEKNVAVIIENDLKKKLMNKDASFIENKWFPAAHIEHYVANPLNKSVLTIGPIEDIHQYFFLNKFRKKIKYGDDAYCLVPSNYFFDAKEKFKKCFNFCDTAAVILSIRNKNIARKFYLLRFKGFINYQKI